MELQTKTEMCVSLALTMNWVREGGCEKAEVTAVQVDLAKEIPWDWGHRGWAGRLCSEGSPVNASLEFWNLGEHQTHLEGMLTQKAALHPKILIRQVWCGAQESAFPTSFQVMLVWGSHFEPGLPFPPIWPFHV